MTRTFTEAEALWHLSTEMLWGNAAGSCREEHLAVALAQIGVGMTTLGTYTYDGRPGNEGDNFWYDEATGNGINSLGLPNKGLTEALPLLKKLKPEINHLGSKLGVSISPGDKFVPEEIKEMAWMLSDENAADIIDGNASCPNVVVDGKPKPNVSYDIKAFREYVSALSEGADEVETAIKIAPITEFSMLQSLVETCIEFGVNYIVAANTIPNCYLEKPDGTPAISMGRGGLSGAALRPIVSAMVQMIAPMIAETSTKLIAVGGISCGQHAYDYLRLGADGFALNTAFSRHSDPRVFQEIATGDGVEPGLVDLLVKHGLPN